MAFRCWPAFSGIWILSPSLKNIVSFAELDRTPSDKTFWFRMKRINDAKPTGYDPGLNYDEYVSRACPSVKTRRVEKCVYSYALNVLLNIFFFASKAPNYEGLNLCAD